MSPVKSGDSTFDEGLVHPRPQYATSGLPSGLSGHDSDTSYKSPSTHVQWASNPAMNKSGSTLEPPAPPPHGGRPGSAKRQFSFQNVLHPRRRTSSSADDTRPISRGGLSFISRGASRGGTKNGTEEERAGLVKGDSQTRLSGDEMRTASPPHYSDPDDWEVTGGPSPPMRTVEGSYMDVEQTRLPRYTSSPGPAETIRPVRRDTGESPHGGNRQRGGGSGSGSQDEKGGGSFL